MRPALEILAAQAPAGSRLSTQTRRTLRAVVRTRPQDSLALAGLAAQPAPPSPVSWMA